MKFTEKIEIFISPRRITAAPQPPAHLSAWSAASSVGESPLPSCRGGDDDTPWSSAFSVWCCRDLRGGEGRLPQGAVCDHSLLQGSCADSRGYFDGDWTSLFCNGCLFLPRIPSCPSLCSSEIRSYSDSDAVTRSLPVTTCPNRDLAVTMLLPAPFYVLPTASPQTLRIVSIPIFIPMFSLSSSEIRVLD